VVGNVVGWTVYVAIVLFTFVSFMLSERWMWRFLNQRHVQRHTALATMCVASVFNFLGLWLVFDVGWIMFACHRLARKNLRRRVHIVDVAGCE
jgi:hypothetical protein